MAGSNVSVKKLQKCRNCFSITQNDCYIVAVGDQIVVYRKRDLEVQCVISSKVFSHPYSLRFLSKDVFLIKNNCAQYILFDISKQEILWKFKPRGYKSIDVDLVVSADGTVVYDILTHHNDAPCCTQLIISPFEQCYETRELTETDISAKDMEQGYYAAKTKLSRGQNGRIHLLRSCWHQQTYPENFSAIHTLYQKDFLKHSQWVLIKQWHVDKPIDYKVILGGNSFIRRERQQPIYFDESCIVWNNLLCQDFVGGKCYKLNTDGILRTPTGLQRKNYPQFDMDLWLVEQLPLSPKIRQYKTLDPVDLLSEFEQENDNIICDIAVLDSKKKMLVGTMAGLFLLEC